MRLLTAAPADLAAAATTLRERLDGRVERIDAEGAEARLADWADAVARGDGAGLARRLAADGLTADSALPALGGVRVSEPPGWTRTLDRALELAPAVAAHGAATGPHPYAELARPFVAAAREQLGAVDPGLIAPSALTQLERPLTQRLAWLGARAHHVAFTGFRAARTTPLGRLLLRASERPGRVHYDAFAAWMLAEGGLADALRDLPVLARLLATASDAWAGATRELLERLEADRAALDGAFGTGSGPVTAAEGGLSDPHRGARAVATLRFASGVRVVYKPKDVGTEAAFGALLRSLDADGAGLDLRTPRVLPRAGYGWVEHIAPAPCAKAAAIDRYYRRAGRLLCLVYALAGTDCHRENLIAAGEHPVLIDVESLLHPRASVDGLPRGIQQVAHDELASGVLGTGMLPSWQADGEAAGRPAWDVSALHTAAPGEEVVRGPRWEGIGTDAIALVDGPVEVGWPASRPMLGDKPARLDEHADAVLDGFGEAYDAIHARRDALLAAGSALGDLGRCTVRFIYRNTRVYGVTLGELLDPAYLRDGLARSLRIEQLWRALPDERSAAWRPLVNAECAALERLDVPLFTVAGDGTVLELDGAGPLAGCLHESGARRAAGRIRALCPADRARQIGFIAGSIYAGSAHAGGSAPRGERRRRDVDATTPELVAIAVGLADEIAARAVRFGDDATWIAPQYLPRLERYQLQPVGYDLHSGACGMALFLASAEATTGVRFRPTVEAALRPLRDGLADDPDGLARAVGRGGAVGMGSVVYALTRIAGLLDAPALLDDARAAAALISDDPPVTAGPDVFSGLAGDLLGLLALEAAAPDPGLRARATALGRALLACRSDGGWVSSGGRRLTGFSHGAAGIAYALARLAAVTGDPGFRDAAAVAVEHEDRSFVPAAGNWLDLRDDVQPAFKAAWCHGAPGIGLARIGSLATLGGGAARADADAAIATTLALRGGGPDHLCCGTLGCADILLEAGVRLDRPELIAAARARIARVARRAQADGGFLLHTSLPRRVHMPGFFMGMAGIGYVLLRAVAPDRLPCVLLWD